ncbi:hypothetical protein ACF08N_04895 [Streptomyces sp. NPDC015127]|uniref:hypothetical protein n=1 Tax=Streptomyces sp. NPDC015127 TaxID=3364939 RepID=UPI0036F8267E
MALPTTFPDDLVQAQREWIRTYVALAKAGPRDYTSLRRRLLRLSVRVWWHPYWSTPQAGGPAAPEDLRRLAVDIERREAGVSGV